MLYFYFDYVEQTTQTPLNILSTLLHQLLSQLEALPDTVSLLLARVRQNKPLPSWKQMIDIFIATANNQDEVFLVLDALDESDPNKNREKVLELLDYIFDQSNIRALITSRPFPSDIKSAFASLPKVVIAASKDDIRTFLTHKIASSRRAWIKKEVDDILRERIIYTLAMKSQGMYVLYNFVSVFIFMQKHWLTYYRFLLPALEIDNILGQTNRTQLIQCLNALPSGIEGNLGLTMQRIRTQDSQGDSKATLAMRILTLLCTSRQPLQVQGLQYAIATSPQSEKLDDLTDESMILECCHGLIKIDAETYIVRFVHMSIFEYLSARRDEFFPKGEATVAMNCMRHLTLIGKSKASIDIKFDPFVNSFFNPFLRYASLSWGDHAAVDFGDTVEHQTLQLLNDATALCIWSNIYRPYHTYWASFPPTPANITRPSFAPLHVAAIFDIPQLCKKELARSTTDPNVQDHQQRTPLMFAAAHGAHKVLSILLSRDDVDVNKTDIFGQTALVVAVLYGTLETMRPLLESPRLDVNSGLYTDQVCQTDDASELEKVKLLLTSRPELDVNNDQAPLWYLLTYKEEYEALQIVFDRPTFNPRRFGNYVTDGARRILSATSITSAKMLESAILALQKLDHARCLSSDISEGLLYAIWPCFHVLGDDFVDDETLKSYFPGIFCSTANTTHEMDLQAKLSDFRESLADIFARNDITLGLKDSAGRSFLHLAAASGLHAFLNQILAQGYDVNIQDSEGQAPLHFAADQGDRDTMRILLRAGATTDTKTKRGMTPLHFAVYHSKDRGVLQELLAHGADVNVVNELGETALHLAALLEAPDTDESELDDSDNDSATDAASEDSPSNRIDILIAYGSNIDAKTTTGQTAIHYAARNPQGGEVIEQLIRYGLDVHAVDVFGCSALIFAAESPNVETTVVLLMHEVDVDVVGILGSTALGAAVAGGRKEHAMVLLHAGADPDIPNCYGSSVRSYIENSDYWKSTIELPERANPPEVINKAHHIRANMTRRLQLLLDNFSDPCFGREIGYRLHKQLLALGDWNAAVTALTFFLTRRDDSERISFVCQCTACLASTELQFSCRECEATVICNDCFTNLPITDLPWCDGHNFIKVNGNMRLKLEEMYGGKENAYFNFLREVLEKYWIPL